MHQVSWSTWHEWHTVYNQLFSKNDVIAQSAGILRVETWSFRQRLPISIQSTADLTHLLYTSVTSVTRLALATVIVRTINGLVDTVQKGAYRQAVSHLATSIDLPLYIVDLRHDIAHNALPSLRVLQLAALDLLDWLQTHYWKVQEQALCNTLLAVEASWHSSSEEMHATIEQQRDMGIALLVHGKWGTYLQKSNVCLIPQKEELVLDFTAVLTKHEMKLRRGQKAWHWFGAALWTEWCTALVTSGEWKDEAYEMGWNWMTYFLSPQWHQCSPRRGEKNLCEMEVYEDAGYPLEELWTSVSTMEAPEKRRFETLLQPLFPKRNVSEKNQPLMNGNHVIECEMSPCPLGVLPVQFPREKVADESWIIKSCSNFTYLDEKPTSESFSKFLKNMDNVYLVDLNNTRTKSSHNPSQSEDPLEESSDESSEEEKESSTIPLQVEIWT